MGDAEIMEIAYKGAHDNTPRLALPYLTLPYIPLFYIPPPFSFLTTGEMSTPSRCGRMDQCVVMGVSE